MKSKSFFLTLVVLMLLSIATTAGGLFLVQKTNQSLQTQTLSAHTIGSTILGEGTIHSQNEATLHFQTGGKLTYAPFKEGDTVTQGQTIAELDTYTLQRQLTQALNAYRSTRDTYDQTNENAQTGVLQNGQKSGLNIYNQSSIGGDQQSNAINDAAKRILDQNQANLDSAVVNVELANNALQLATLTAPFTGILTNEDVTVAGQNITPVTSFSLADPTALVFRANIAASDIDYVSVGAKATVHLTGSQQTITGTVIKIYPQKITTSAGEVYQVDIQGPNIQTVAKLDQAGTVLIESNAHQDVVTVPTWTILDHNRLWVSENGKPLLKTVIVGKTHGNVTEILGGLNPEDKIVTNPAAIAAQVYSLL